MKLPEKIEIFWKFPWKNLIIFTRIHDAPDFTPDWHRCRKQEHTIINIITQCSCYGWTLSSTIQMTELYAI